METLEQFIQSNPESIELKRALAVQMSQRGYNYREIRDVLQVSLGFVSACRQRYESEGLRDYALDTGEPKDTSVGNRRKNCSRG